MKRAVWVAVLAASIGTAADPPTVGTEPGQTLPGPFSAFVVWPKSAKPVEGMPEARQNDADAGRSGKFHCLVTRYGLDPTVAVFMRDVPASDDTTAAKLLKQLDAQVRTYRQERLHAFVIFLRLKEEFLKDDKRLPEIESIEQLGTKLEIKDIPLALDQTESKRTEAYKLTKDAAVTIVIYENHQVRARMIFNEAKPLDDASLQAVTAEIKKVLKKSSTN